MVQHYSRPNDVRVGFGSAHLAVDPAVVFIDLEMGAAKADPNVVWTAVVLYHPPFLDSQEKPWLLTKLHDMHVDMVFAGHDHFLEYTYLGRNEPIKYWG